jgi:hypothetical protein
LFVCHINLLYFQYSLALFRRSRFPHWHPSRLRVHLGQHAGCNVGGKYMSGDGLESIASS